MSYVPNYESDVFISFADEDNACLAPGQPGWVDKLAELVEKLLRAAGISGAEVTTRIPGNVPEDDRIRALDRSAAVVLIVSPAYVQSAWLKDRRARERIVALASTRPTSALLVMKTVVDEDSVPPELWRLKHRVFYRLDEEGVPLPHGLCGSDDTYMARVNDLANALARELTRLRTGKTTAHEPGRAGGTPRAKVFLAETTPDLEESRAEIERFLDMHNIDVYPEGHLPGNLDEARAAIMKGLSGCRVFVQLLGTHPAHLNPNGHPRLQLAMAESMAASGVRVMQWRDPALDLRTLAEKDLLSLLFRPTVRAETLSDFKAAIKDATEQPATEQREALPIVYVDARPEETQSLRAIFGPMHDVRWDWHATKALKEVKQMCDIADGVLVYWGSGESGPSQSRYYEFLKQWRARKKCEHCLRIYDGPPPNKPPIEGEGLPVVSGRSGFEELRRFITNLLRANR